MSNHKCIPFKINQHSCSLVECPICDWDVAGLIPIPVIPKALKMALAALFLGAQH